MIGQTISHFEIEAHLGRGGMGEVYLASDLRLGRKVALKFLTPSVLGDERAAHRFLREARAASALDHPNVCTVFEFGQSDDGRVFLAMSYCAGGSMEEALSHGPLALDQVLDLAAQAAAGLACAHEAGIVHRDIKPANLLLTEAGQLKVADFGIAHVDGATQLTGEQVAGTPAYMAPEQIEGGLVDGRCDQWALGAVMFELLTGQRAFRGRGPAVVHSILEAPLPRLEETVHGVPGPVCGIVNRLLSRSSRGRYESTWTLVASLEELASKPSKRAAPSPHETDSRTFSSRRHERPQRNSWPQAAVVGPGLRGLLELASTDPQAETSEAPTREVLASKGTRALSWMGGAALILAVLATVFFTMRGLTPSVNDPSAPSAFDPITVAVMLPRLASQSAEHAGIPSLLQRLIADGLAHDRNLHIASAEAVLSLREQSEPSDQVDAEAGTSHEKHGIEWQLEGDLEFVGEQLIASMRLIDASSGEVEAAFRSDSGETGSRLAMADSIVNQVQRALGVPPDRLVDVFAADFASSVPGASELYVQGLRHLSEFRLNEAEVAFHGALELDPDYAMARYRLAWVLMTNGQVEEARGALEIAMAVQLPRRESLYVEATREYFLYDTDASERVWRELLDEFPYEVEARTLLAMLLRDVGRAPEAIEEMMLVEELEPGTPTPASFLGELHLLANDPLQAIPWLEKYVHRSGESANSHDMLGRAFAAQEEWSLAEEQFRAALRIDPAFHYSTLELARTLYALDDWLSAGQGLDRLSHDTKVPVSIRVDAAIWLAHLRRGEARFRDSSQILVELTDEFESDVARVKVASQIQALNDAALGNLEEAFSQLEELVNRTTSGDGGNEVPFEILFHHARLGLLIGETHPFTTLCGSDGDTPQEAHPGEKTDPGHLETTAVADRAATALRSCTYLAGLLMLKKGALEDGLAALEQTTRLQGAKLWWFELDLAVAYLERGRAREALAALSKANQNRQFASFEGALEETLLLATRSLALSALDPGNATSGSLRQIVSDRWRNGDREFQHLFHLLHRKTPKPSEAEVEPSGQGRGSR